MLNKLKLNKQNHSDCFSSPNYRCLMTLPSISTRRMMNVKVRVTGTLYVSEYLMGAEQRHSDVMFLKLLLQEKFSHKFPH